MTASARDLTRGVVAERPRDTYRTSCAYCGARCFGYACTNCRDLPQLENQLFSESNETAAPLHPGSATVSQPEGV